LEILKKKKALILFGGFRYPQLRVVKRFVNIRPIKFFRRENLALILVALVLKFFMRIGQKKAKELGECLLLVAIHLLESGVVR